MQTSKQVTAKLKKRHPCCSWHFCFPGGYQGRGECEDVSAEVSDENVLLMILSRHSSAAGRFGQLFEQFMGVWNVPGISLEVRDCGRFRWECLWKGETKPPTLSNCLFVICVFVATILAQLLAINRSSFACQLGCT